MFSLVLFTGRNPKTTAVIDSNRIELRTGSKSKVRWYNGRWYVAQVLATGDNRRKLNELLVLTTGEIMDRGSLLSHECQANPSTSEGTSSSCEDASVSPPQSQRSVSEDLPKSTKLQNMHADCLSPNHRAKPPHATSTESDSTEGVSTLPEKNPSSSGASPSLDESSVDEELLTVLDFTPNSSSKISPMLDQLPVIHDEPSTAGDSFNSLLGTSDESLITDGVATSLTNHLASADESVDSAKTITTPSESPSSDHVTETIVRQDVTTEESDNNESGEQQSSKIPHVIDITELRSDSLQSDSKSDHSRTQSPVPLLVSTNNDVDQGTISTAPSVNADNVPPATITHDNTNKPQNLNKNRSDNDAPGPSQSQSSTLKMVELVEDSGVKIRSTKLEFIKIKNAGKLTSLIRRLLDEIVGVENLKRMRAVGRDGWPRVPQATLDAIEVFVAAETGEKIGHKDFMRRVTNYLNSLRQP